MFLLQNYITNKKTILTMRTIKFRGKSAVNDKWLFGCLSW